jgi:hypothetical protein
MASLHPLHHCSIWKNSTGGAQKSSYQTNSSRLPPPLKSDRMIDFVLEAAFRVRAPQPSTSRENRRCRGDGLEFLKQCELLDQRLAQLGVVAYDQDFAGICHSSALMTDISPGTALREIEHSGATPAGNDPLC